MSKHHTLITKNPRLQLLLYSPLIPHPLGGNAGSCKQGFNKVLLWLGCVRAGHIFIGAGMVHKSLQNNLGPHKLLGDITRDSACHPRSKVSLLLEKGHRWESRV